MFIASRRSKRVYIFVLFLLSLLCSTGTFATVASWTTAASYGPDPIYDSSSVLLRSGMVLMVGGFTCCINGYSGLPPNAEVFDPAAGSWSTAGNNYIDITYQSLTLLNSGKVLMVGGWNGGTIIATAQLYDPASNTWASAGSLHSGRAGHTATLLPSGKVLVAGGYVADFSQPSAGAEIYDPQSDSWQQVADMASPHNMHTATALQDGRVLVIGGTDQTTTNVEIFNPSTGQWRAPSQLVPTLYGHSATLLPSGKVLIAGGFGPSAFRSAVSIYDPSTDRWTSASSLKTERMFHSATLLPDGRVLVVGGENQISPSSAEVLANAEIYSPAHDTWTTAASLHEARQAHFATLLHSGTVLVTGGHNQSGFNATPELLQTGVPSVFVSMQPARLLDTRAGATTADGIDAGGGPLGAKGRHDLSVVNRAGLPSTGVAAVALNVTAVTPTAQGFITVWPSGIMRPNASNLNFVQGDTVASMVIAQVGSNGKVSLFNSAGFTQIVVDIVGWFPATSGLSSFVPARLLDTRAGTNTIDGLAAGGGAMTAKSTLDLPIVGRATIPASAAGSALINLTATNTTAEGFLDLWTQGATRPRASNLNFAPAETVPNLVIAQTGSAGGVSVFNSAGSTDVIADAVGWFPGSAEYNPIPASRLLDTRIGTADIPAGPLVKHGVLDLPVNNNGLPASNLGAVVLNVTVTDATGAGFLTVWPSGGAQPNASNLNFNAGQTRANLVISKVGDDGHVWISSSSPTADVIVDAIGWFPPAQ